MSDKCVVCNGVGEGKPLYKKLGSSDCSTDIFTALHEMQLISLPLQEKDNHYICWDCDESVAEEYLTFIKTENKRKAEQVKRKKQDEARNIKLKKKLKLAFKKVHEENLRASGITPPVSKYKMKEKEREENKYHSSHCILCKCSFEDNQGRSYQRFSLLKMVNDEHDVAQVLQKLDVHLNIDLPDEIKRKRFVCCLCYNKMRRDYKSKNKNELEKMSKSITQNSFINKINNETKDIFKRRPTAQEHAAEIAKLIPPSLANLYKVVTQDDKDYKNVIKEGHCDDGNSKDTKKRKHRQSCSTSDSNSSYDSSSDSSSSTSSSDSSDSENDHPRKSSANNNSSCHTKNMTTTKKYKSGKKDFHVVTTKHNNFNNDFNGMAASRNLKGTESSGFSEGEGAMEIIQNGVCNLCGLAYSFRPKSFWNSLDSPMPSVTGVTVVDALKILDSKLAAVSANVRKKKFVCKPCYSKVCNGFRSQIIQRIAQKKGIAVDQIEASKLKVKGMDNSLSNPPVRKINGTCENKFENRSMVTDATKKSLSESHRKKKSKNKDKRHHSKKHRDQVKSQVHDRTTDCDVKLNSRSDHRKAVFKFTNRRSDHINSPKFAHDMALLNLINQSRHLQYKGKVVVLYNVCVNVVEMKELLPPSAFKNEPVRLELLKNVHLYSNLYRNLKNRTEWSTCILCHKTKLLLKETTHWLEDPVAPPNLMVPLRWAQLSLVSSSSPPAKPNIAVEDGKVCPKCHQNLAVKFGKFVGAKVAVSHGLSSEKIVLDKYKVSFDSNAMNIIADPLERVMAIKEITKKHKIGPKSKQQAMEYYIAKPDKSPTNSRCITNESVIPVSDGEITKVDNSKLKDEFAENKDNVSLDLALSESSDSENDAKVSDISVSKQDQETESICKKSSNEILLSDIPTENVSIPSDVSISNDLTETTKEENSDDAKVEADNVKSSAISSKIDSKDMNKNITMGINGDEADVDDRSIKTSTIIHTSEDTNDTLNSVNKIQSREAVIMNETAVDKFSNHGQSSHNALSLEKLNKTLQSHINISECSYNQEHMPLVADKTEVHQNFAHSKTIVDSAEMHESKDNNSNEDNGSESCEHTTKQIDLSKIMISLSTSHATHIRNQVNDSSINNSESTKLGSSQNYVATEDNNNSDYCKLSTMKEIGEVANQDELKNRISPESSAAVENNCILNKQIDDVMVSDTLISNSNNQSVNLKKSEIEITSFNNNRNATSEKTLANFENKASKTTISNVADNILLPSNAKDIIDVNDAVTSSCCANGKGDCNKLLIDANAQTGIDQENTRLSVFVSETSSSDLVMNKADENNIFCNSKNKLEIYEADSVGKNTKQIDNENIKEHCRSAAVIDMESSTESQINGETWHAVEKVICPEIVTDFRTSSDDLVNKISESISNCDIDVERTTDINTGCCLEMKDHNSVQVAPELEEKDQQETRVEKESHESINNDKGKYNSLTSPQVETEWKIREAISGTIDIKTVKNTTEMTDDGFAKSIEPSAKAHANDIRYELTVEETMNHDSFSSGKKLSTIKHVDIKGNDDGISSSQLDYNKQRNEDTCLVTKKSSIEVVSDKKNLRKSVTERNSGESKRKCEKDHTDSEMLPKTKKLMTNSNHIEKEHITINNILCKCNDGCDNKDCANGNKFNDSITPIVNMELEAKENENILPFVKNTPTCKPIKRARAASKNRKRWSVSNGKTREKCLSDLIDNEKATSVDVVTDYLNSQREKIIEIIKPISSEEIHNNAKTCVETVSENLMKIRSKLDNSIHSELSLANASDKELQNESSQDQIDNHDLGFFSLEPDPLVEDIGENTVAPFAQRKKCRGRPPNTGSDQDSYGSASNIEKDPNAEEVTSSCFLNIWQSIQGVSLDDLLTKDLHQPLRIQQYNVGVVLALNDLRNLIGASLEDLVSWLQKLIPLELSEKGLKPSTEKISAFMFSLNKSNVALDPKKLNELLSEDLFVNDKSICNLHQEEVNKNMCFVEDFMEESSNVKEGEIRWDDYLAPVNLDNLLKGKESRVTWEQFNNGLLYALWKVNNLLHGDEGNFVKWLSLTSTTPMKASDYLAMAKAVIAIDKHLVTFPEEINKLVAPIVIKSDKEIPIKKIPSRNKSIPNVPPVDDDEVILEKITVKSGSKTYSLCENAEQKKRPLCDRLNEAINNNIRKQTIIPTHSLRPPSKKMARVLPQPSQESATSSENQTGKGYLQVGPKDRKIEEINKKYATIVKEDKVQQKEINSSHLRRLKKNNISVSLNSRSASYKIYTRSKNQISTKSGESCIIDPVSIAGHSSSEDRVPVITKVTSSSNTDFLSIKKHKNNNADINIENENINVCDQSTLMSNESLQTQIQYALVNQAKIPIGDPSANLSHPNNASGIPMIPVMSPSGYFTMIPLPMGIPTLPSSPIVGTSLPYNVKSPNIAANLPYAMQEFSALKESPKEKELVCKVSDLEKQLQEIQKQNSQLFELNKKLLQKTTNAEEAPKGLSKTRKSSLYKDALIPSLQASGDSLLIRRRPRGRPRKDAQKTFTLNTH